MCPDAQVCPWLGFHCHQARSYDEATNSPVGWYLRWVSAGCTVVLRRGCLHLWRVSRGLGAWLLL